LQWPDQLRQLAAIRQLDGCYPVTLAINYFSGFRQPVVVSKDHVFSTAGTVIREREYAGFRLATSLSGAAG
jgi:hypothetical protein